MKVQRKYDLLPSHKVNKTIKQQKKFKLTLFN